MCTRCISRDDAGAGRASVYQKSFRHRLRERCVILAATVAAAVCIAFYRHPWLTGGVWGACEGRFCQGGKWGSGEEGTRSHADATLFLCPSPTPLFAQGPVHHCPLITTSAPPTPPGRRHARLLALSPTAASVHATARNIPITHIHTHARTRLPFFWSRARTAYWTQFFSYFGPFFKERGPNRFFFVLSTGFQRDRYPSSRPARRDYGSFVFRWTAYAKVAKKKCKYYFRAPIPLGNNVSTLQVEWAPRWGRRHAGALSIYAVLTLSFRRKRGNVCKKNVGV